MLANGVPLRVAQEVLGDRTIAATADIYRHVAAASSRGATEGVAAVLGVGS